MDARPAIEPLAQCRLEDDRFVAPLQRYEREHRSEIAQELLRARDRECRKREARAQAREAEIRRREEKRAYADDFFTTLHLDTDEELVGNAELRVYFAPGGERGILLGGG